MQHSFVSHPSYRLEQKQKNIAASKMLDAVAKIDVKKLTESQVIPAGLWQVKEEKVN